VGVTQDGLLYQQCFVEQGTRALILLQAQFEVPEIVEKNSLVQQLDAGFGRTTRRIQVGLHGVVGFLQTHDGGFAISHLVVAAPNVVEAHDHLRMELSKCAQSDSSGVGEMGQGLLEFLAREELNAELIQ